MKKITNAVKTALGMTLTSTISGGLLLHQAVYSQNSLFGILVLVFILQCYFGWVIAKTIIPRVKTADDFIVRFSTMGIALLPAISLKGDEGSVFWGIILSVIVLVGSLFLAYGLWSESNSKD
ncbi:MAG: hypothetical protein P8P30_01830 [Rickettsiales bacterium]|nr:hypothetical protein [Rickettsiales bacterium]